MTGQRMRNPDGSTWLFDTGAQCLDFAYTGALGDGPAWEQLHSPSDLSDWLSKRFAQLDTDASERELVDALALRAAIGSVVRARNARPETEPDDIDTINLYAATPDIPPALDGGHRQAGRSSTRIGQALSTIARDAVHLFGGDMERLRECAADNCGLIFYDESRSNNRRWCSMQRCGNRAKVRAHRARATQ